MSHRAFYVYILESVSRRVMYVGVTSDLLRRLGEHKTGLQEGFTRKFHTHRLVYFETFQYSNKAIAREKVIKRWTRAKKNALVESTNPHWLDLSEGLEDFLVCQV